MNMRRLFHPIIGDLFGFLTAPVIVLALQLTRMLIWPLRNDLDPIAHFLGGAAIALGATIVADRWRGRRIIPKQVPRWLTCIAVFGLVAQAGIYWEFYEFASDRLFEWHAQITLTDTLSDLLLDLVGGAVFVLGSLFRRNHN